MADLGPVKGNGFQPAPATAWRAANAVQNHDWQGAPEANPSGGDRPISPDDWAFLQNLGDPEDEFYTMDKSFRESFQKQVDPDRMV